MGVRGRLLPGGVAHLDFAGCVLDGDEVGPVVAGGGGALVGRAAGKFFNRREADFS